MISLFAHIKECAQRTPDRVALLACDEHGKITETISYAELLLKIKESAAYLQSLGLRAGDRVALDYAAGTPLLILSWAAWAMGVVTVPLDQKRDTGELRDYKIKAANAKKLLSEGMLPQTGGTPHENAWMPTLEHEALILFTSGTTARPKGARLTLNNLVVNAAAINKWLDVSENDRFMVVLPLHHINSTTFCLSALLAGASVVVPPRYSNSHFWEQAAETGATYTSIVQSILYDQLNRQAEFERAKPQLALTRIQIGSAPVVPTTALEFMRRFGVPLYQGYGQTETALRVTGMPADLPRPLYEKLIEENSIGEPMPWADLQITDEKGSLLGEHEEGELVVRGPAVMQGYVGGEEAFRDGYFLTGDIGLYQIINGRRFFFLKGRKKEIIIKGGINISPVALEEALKKISPSLEQAYAVGIADKRYGEEVGAALIWHNNAEASSAMRSLQLQLLSGTTLLSAYETPRYLATLAQHELPLTSTGKVQRASIKKELAPKRWVPLEEIFSNNRYRFTVIQNHSPFQEASWALYNHCWQPLQKSAAEYVHFLTQYLTLAAIDSSGILAGQISFALTKDSLTCVSICSATYKPKPVSESTTMPSPERVRAYVLGGHDGVFNFHHALGASLVEVTPNGQPEDKSSCGYTLLLAYPPGTGALPAENEPISAQLIAAVRLLAHDLSLSVYAVSRPGGLATYLSRA